MLPLTSRTLFRSEQLAVCDVRCTSPRCGCTRPEHSSGYSIAFVRSGVFIKHTGREQVACDPTRVVFFSPNRPYRVSHPIDGGDRCISVSVSREVVREALAGLDPAAADAPEPAFPAPDAPADPAWFLWQDRLVRALDSGRVCALGVEESACRMVGAVLDAAFRSRGGGRRPALRDSTRAAHRDLANAARAVLAASYHQRLCLPGLARRVHASPYHLSRTFHRVTGLTLARHVSRLRLRDALERLGDGERDLTALALACGFYDHSHFTNAFRREFGAAPGAIQREHAAPMSNAVQV